MPAFSLKQISAVVLGASQGIGAAIAKAMAEAGANVILVARNEDNLRKVAALLPGTGHQQIRCDLADDKSLQDFLADQRVAQTDILVLNTAGPGRGAIAEADPQLFAQAFQQHVVVNQRLVQHFLPGMRTKKFGRIIPIISTSVRQPIPGLGVSNTIRGAVASWAKTLAMEVAADGITVNSILPGYTQTERLSSLMRGAAEQRKVSVDIIESEWRSQTPMRRFGAPSEIAAAAVFLASPAASFITGVALPVDGGRISAI